MDKYKLTKIVDNKIIKYLKQYSLYGKGRRKMKNKGITLIALVISIIVLLILAGVTIAALSGDNGILTRAKEAKEKTEQAQQEEEQTLSNIENILENYKFENVNADDTNPAGAMPSDVTILENDANKGIVIKDKNNNEWVWVEIPKTTVFSGLTIDTTRELTEQNYNDIKDSLVEYASIYRKSYDKNDEWYDGCGLTSKEYTTTYRLMLKNIYTYGGFWIGRYEAGIEGSIEDVSKARTEHSDIIIGTSPKAISQKDAIPYNWIYCSEAQALAKEMTPDSNHTSNLMFGLQWNLVCKFLEIKAGLTIEEIKSDSSNWGNYNNVTRTITSKKAKQEGTPWTSITEIKPAETILLSTGASEETNKMNIYDFAGNEFEWTLENSFNNESPCIYRGGSCNNQGVVFSAWYYNGYEIDNSYYSIAFRSTFYNN